MRISLLPMLSFSARARQEKIAPKRGELDISSNQGSVPVDDEPSLPNRIQTASPICAPPVAPSFEWPVVVGHRYCHVNQTSENASENHLVPFTRQGSLPSMSARLPGRSADRSYHHPHPAAFQGF